MYLCEGYAHRLRAALNGYYQFNSGSSTISTTTPHQDINGRGSGAYVSSAVGGIRTYSFPNGEEWIHFAWRSTLDGQTPIIEFLRNGGTQLSVEVNGAGAITVRRGTFNQAFVEIANTVANPTNVSLNVWHWFWMRYTADTVAGRMRIYLDGISNPVYDSGVTNTAAAGISGWDQIYWRGDLGGFSPSHTDVVSFTGAEYTAIFGTSLPELYVPAIVPTGIDTNTFTAGTYTAVDEIPWSTADYASANATALELIMSNSGLGYTPPTVYAVANTWYMERDGSILSMQSRLKSGAADVTGASVMGIGSAQYTERQEFYPYDPNGSIAWTYAAVTAAKFGVKTA